MKKLIMIMTVVAGVAAFAECEAKQEAKSDAAQVESLAALKARKVAESCGCTVEEMNAERNRKEAEKVGCPVEKWAKMSVKDRIAFRKQAKAQ